MPDLLDQPSPELAALWRTSRAGSTPSLDRELLAGLSRDPRRESVRAHLFTIGILSVTLAVLTWFGVGYLSAEAGAVRVGIGLMALSLASRIFIEAFSLVLLLRIDFAEVTRAFVQANQRFLAFRAQVHRGVVGATFLLYSVGFYFFLYAARDYLHPWAIIVLAVSFPAIMGAIYTLAIRPGQRRERKALGRLEVLAKDLAGAA